MRAAPEQRAMSDDDDAAAAARSFKRRAAARHAPSLQLRATLHCDAAVRTADAAHRNLRSLLSAHLPDSAAPPLRVLTAEHVTVTAPRALPRALLDSLRDPSSRLSQLNEALFDRLESATLALSHDTFALPLLTVVAVWVCEPDISAALAAFPTHQPPLVLLVARPTAQDAHALQRVQQSLASHPAPVLVLRLQQSNSEGSKPDPQQAQLPEASRNETPHPHSVTAVAADLDSRVRAQLNLQLNDAALAATRIRRSTRTSFRSWFSTSTTSTTRIPDASHLPASTPDLTATTTASDATRLAPNTVAFALRQLADLALMAGRYTDACEAYRGLAAEVRSLSSAASVHHASALEMEAISLALIDGSNSAIGTAFEAAIVRYAEANRPELSARAALRAVDFCLAAGFPDSAAGVLVRAITLLRPSEAQTSSPPSLDVVLAMLCAACAHAFIRLKQMRRASRFAFFAAVSFARLRHFVAAAAVAVNVDASAMQRPSIRHHVQYWMGEAALFSSEAVAAVRHFSSVLAEAQSSSQSCNVQLYSSVVQAFLRALKNGAAEKLSVRWDSGVAFPLLDVAFSFVRTHDMGEADSEWHALEDEVLEDVEFFGKLANGGKTAIKRERRVEALVSELRHAKRNGNNDPGGSLEMKIRRMRDLANARKRRRRAASLLERGAVIGEPMFLHVRLANPLQFPVYISSLSAVVSHDGQCYSMFDKHNEHANTESPPPVQLLEAEPLTIPANSSKEVVLRIVGRKAGTMQIIGLCWKFSIGMLPTFVPDTNTVFAPGFALLHRRGRRLNDTRRHRASDVPLYEEDKSLTVTIAPVAPKLKAELHIPHLPLGMPDEDDPMLILRAGEVRKGHLKLENHGPMPLDSIVLRVGTPQTLYLGLQPEVEGDGDQKRIFAIGMKEQPVEQSEIVAAARVSLRLDSGQSARIPVWIRAAISSAAFAQRSPLSENIKLQRRQSSGNDDRVDGGVPQRDIRLAIAYGSEQPRMSRVSQSFKVRPSIMVSPRFLREADLRMISPQASGKIGCLFGVEVEHAGPSETEDADFDITRLTVTSRHGWKPMLLPKPVLPKATKRLDIRPAPNTLRINETATFFVFLVRDRDVKDTVERDDNTEPRTHTWGTYICHFDNEPHACRDMEEVELLSPTALDNVLNTGGSNEDIHKWDRCATAHFVVCSKHHLNIHRHGNSYDRLDRVYVTVGWRTSDGTEGDIHIPSIDPLRWMKDSKRVDSGQVTVPNVVEAPQSQVNPNLMQDVVEGIGALQANDFEEDPVQVQVCHPLKMEHDFFQSSECSDDELASDQSSAVAYPAVVPVDVLVKNVSNGVLDVAFAASTEGGVADGDRGRYWTGDVSMSLRAIAPGAERTICLTAVLISPGRYNMCRFTMLYQTSSFVPNRKRQHIAMKPSFMTVEAVGNYKFCEDDVSVDRIETAPLIPGRRRPGSSKRKSNEIQTNENEETSTVRREDVSGSRTLGNRAETWREDTQVDIVSRQSSEKMNHSAKRSSTESATFNKSVGDMESSGSLGWFGRPRRREEGGDEVVTQRTRSGSIGRKRSDAKSAQLLSELKKDAFWNDADTDEEE